ncbi:hypothetical protein BpHYR1_002874 [Brachionus plicatilis]|uniref:Uncharacterized protein n=1 Tax=Brachionus plicatilis TaxID=10195 RepID=A0A3M7QJK9_BRAPC|nr:hypothetical protein BpHYR1_002874 [Brachionus plicatilis]
MAIAIIRIVRFITMAQNRGLNSNLLEYGFELEKFNFFLQKNFKQTLLLFFLKKDGEVSFNWNFKI